ncbi:MAG: ABC transporter permease subunit [Treponema sp.]|nr:ABC transporter permease subunit [Treponema sp.]
MLNDKQMAVIGKDIKILISNKRMIGALVVVPVIMAIVLPVIFLLIITYTPEDSSDMVELIKILQYASIKGDDTRDMLINLILNYIIPMFFLLIPIIASSVMASGSFVGEKERNTLETLLYCPLPIKQIFNAKIFASFLLSMTVSVCSFIAMIIAVEIFLLIAEHEFFIPNLNWLIMMLLASPAASFISINLIVRSSAKARTSEEAQQSSLFLVVPLILLIASQLTGIMILDTCIFLTLGGVMAVIATLTFKGSYNKFNCETLLK